MKLDQLLGSSRTATNQNASAAKPIVSVAGVKPLIVETKTPESAKPVSSKPAKASKKKAGAKKR
jgi:hypothetical protein